MNKEEENEDIIDKVNSEKKKTPSYKLEILVDLLLIIYSVYGYFNNVSYYWIYGIVAVISLSVLICIFFKSK